MQVTGLSQHQSDLWLLHLTSMALNYIETIQCSLDNLLLAFYLLLISFRLRKGQLLIIGVLVKQL